MGSFILVGLVGLSLGSFLNVVITRLPQGEPVWAGRSRCPSCRTVLPWYHNFPLISYFRLQGRCSFCGAAIPWRYPLVEFAGMLVSLALWVKFPDRIFLVAYGPFCLALLALSAIDLEHRLLPDAITLPGIVGGMVLALVLPHLSFWGAATGALMGGAFFLAIGWAYEKLTGKVGMGGGDVKLMAMIGAFLGIQALPLVIFISAALGCLAGLGRVLMGGSWREGQWRFLSIPFGPFLAAGASVYLFVGEQILEFLGGG